MIATQLNLFGNLPKPPAKIMEDEDPETDPAPEVIKPVKTKANKANKALSTADQADAVSESKAEESNASGMQSERISVILPTAIIPSDPEGGIYVQRPSVPEKPARITEEDTISSTVEKDETEHITTTDLIVDTPLSDDSAQTTATSPTGLSDQESYTDLLGEANQSSPESDLQQAADESTVLKVRPVEEIHSETPPKTIAPSSETDEPVQSAMDEEATGPEPETTELSAEVVADMQDAKEMPPIGEVITLSQDTGAEAAVSVEKEDEETEVADTEISGEVPAVQKGALQIPPDEELFKRQYYSMRETANMFGVNQSLLRFWENEFTILKPKKNKKGDRYFRPIDIKHLQLIYHLLRVRKFTIEGAREYLKNTKRALDNFTLVERMVQLKTFLQELKVNL